ncbi:MAG: acyl-CoA dehydrogenase family protein [Desulfobacterales bacterium]|nr:acyl-CoA dehydrogenase family protein [Desulfobacterales bacterium]
MPAVKNKEIEMLDKAAAEFARKELAPNREENDRFPFGPFFDSVLQKAFELDFFHLILPESAGGMNQGITALSRLLENLCREDSSMGGIVFTTAAAQQIMLEAGNEAELEKLAGGQTARDCLIGLPVFNNPAEIPNMAEARKNGHTYTLSGSLEYVVLAGVAGHALIPARLEKEDGYSFFLVNLEGPGVEKSEPVLSLGLRACPAVDLQLTNAGAALIGDPGRGDTYFTRMADKFHTAAAAMSAGVMKGSFKEAMEYARARFQGGQEIIKWSEVKMLMANMAVKMSNADMVMTSACHAVDEGLPGWEQSSRAAALHIQEMACGATTDGVQLMGGVGYMKDYGQEKRMRDAKHMQALLGIAPLKRIRFLEKMIK